jgi:hypothetical protein
VTTILASALASLATWPIVALLSGVVSEGTSAIIGFVLWAVVFFPAFIWLKRLRSGD